MKILLSIWLILSLSCVPCLADNPSTQFDIMQETLPQIYPVESQQVSFPLFSKNGDISNPQVAIVDIKGPDNRSLPTKDITSILENQGPVTATGTRATLTFAKPQHFERVGNYNIIVRFTGTAGDGKPVIFTKTLTLNRPAAEINVDELKDRTIELSKWPWSKASKTVSYFIFDPSGKTEITDLSAYGQEILVANSKILAPGKVTVQVVHAKPKGPAGKPVVAAASQESCQPGKRLQLRIGLSGLARPGSFITNLVLYSPSIGGRKLIPVNLSVKDNPVFPLFIIFLGVLGGYVANRISKRWLPYERNEYRYVRLKGELDWLFGVTVDPKNRQKIYNLIDKLDGAREKNEAGEAAAAATDMDGIETELKTFRQERAADFGKTQADVQHLRDQVREYLKYPEHREEAQRILEALSEVEGQLSIDELDRAKDGLAACQKSFDDLRKKHFKAKLDEYRDEIKKAMDDHTLDPNNPKVPPINTKIQDIENALANNQLDQLPEMLRTLAELIDDLQLPGRPARAFAMPRSLAEIAAEAKEITISPPPVNRLVNAVITFTAKAPASLLQSPYQLQWRFSDGDTVTGKEDQNTVGHRFRRAWNYQVECSVLRGGAVAGELPPVTVMILPGPVEKALKAILKKMWINDAILSGLALALAALTGLYALYVNHPFGTLENYILAFLWGFGIDASLKGFTAISKKITE